MSWKKWFERVLFLLRRKTSATYAWLAFHSGLLPLPKRIRRYSEYRSQSAALNHHDFWPTESDDAQLHAIWVVDLITPSQLATSLKKIRSVSWDETLFANRDTDEWMESTRNIRSGGWRNLGAVAPIGAKWFGSITRFRRFPKSFDYATFSVLTVTPSLSAIVGCFYLRDDQISTYMSIMKSHHLPYGEPKLSGSVSIWSPLFIKERLLKQRREELRAEIVKFMECRFGGFFSTFEPKNITTIETLQISDNSSSEFCRMIFNDYDQWTSNFADLKWMYASRAPNGHSVLTFKQRTLDSIDLDGYGKKDASALLSRLALSLPSNWTFESLHHLLGAYDRIVSRLRDSEFTPLTTFSRQHVLFSREKSREMADIRLVTSEIAQNEFSWLRANMIEFKRKPFQGDKMLVLSETLLANLRERAEELLVHQENVRSVRKDMNESFALFEMARIARRSFIASLVSIVVAAAAFWVAFSSSS